MISHLGCPGIECRRSFHGIPLSSHGIPRRKFWPSSARGTADFAILLNSTPNRWRLFWTQMRKMGQNRLLVADIFLFYMPFGCIAVATRSIGPSKILGENGGADSFGEIFLYRLGRPIFQGSLAHSCFLLAGLGRGRPARRVRVVVVGGHRVLLGKGNSEKLRITVIIQNYGFVSRGAAEFFFRRPGKCRPRALKGLPAMACGGRRNSAVPPARNVSPQEIGCRTYETP